MPVYLQDVRDLGELEKFESVLIVPCRFCPAASMAVRTNEPYFEFLKRFLKTTSYEQYIESILSDLEKRGVRAHVFRSYLPHQFVVCMWTSRRRRKLKQLASNYAAVMVLGCETAAQTVQDAVAPASCQVFQGMRTEGIMSIKPRFHFPCNISLDLTRVTPLVYQACPSDPWRVL
jgi:hypothetical protein